MIATELKSRRRQLTLTQAALAARLGVAVTTVSRWETGETPIPPYLTMAMKYLALELEEERRGMTNEQQYAENERLQRWYCAEG